MRALDLTDLRFGRLVALSLCVDGRKKRYWQCLCDCGTTTEVSTGNLRHGITCSCGCLQRQRTSQARSVHNKSRTVEYTSWTLMKGRCLNPTRPEYVYYGGRGIGVCAAWITSFEAFYNDMGPRPSRDHSIDRIDNSGDYEPGNCRWATRSEQQRNTRRNRIVTIDGEAMPLVEAVERHGKHYRSVVWGLRAGKTIEEAIFTAMLAPKPVKELAPQD